jgi:hypothetical protein
MLREVYIAPNLGPALNGCRESSVLTFNFGHE